MGPEGGKGMEDVEMKGVVPRVVMSIFDAVEQADENIEFVVKVCWKDIFLLFVCLSKLPPSPLFFSEFD